MNSKNRIIKAKTSESNTAILTKNSGHLIKKSSGEIWDTTQGPFKTPEKYSSPLRVLAKPKESKSEILCEILRRRNILEESVLKIQKSYSLKEVQLFSQIRDQEEIDLLVATRPGILKILDRQVELKNAEDENKSQSSRPGSHRRLISKGSGEFCEKSQTSFYSSSNKSSTKKQGKNIDLEPQIRKSYQKTYENYKQILLENLESTFQTNLEENRQIIENYWITVIEKLENKLASLSVVTEESEQEPEINEYIEELAAEIEEKIKKEYKTKSKYSKGIPKKEKENLILKLQAELEIQQMNLLENEKKMWKNSDLTEIQADCKEQLWLEHEDLLLRKENELRRQAEFELQEIISSLVKDTDSAVGSKEKLILKEKESQKRELEDLCKSECFEELFLEEIDQFKIHLTPNLQEKIYNELKENLYSQIEIDLKLKAEDEIRKELSENFQVLIDNFKIKLEKDIANKMIELECKFETSRSDVVKKQFEEKFFKVEKELKIGFLRKLDKLKNELRKEFEKVYFGEVKKLKDLVTKEKCEVGQIRAQINVLVSQVTAEKQMFLQEKSCHEEQIYRVSRDASKKKLHELDQSQIKSSPEHSKSPNKKSSFFQLDDEISNILPKPLPPPPLDYFLEESRVISVSPQRRLLKHYNTKEIVSGIIMKNYEELGTKNKFCRIIDTPSRPKSTIPYISENYSSEKSMYIKETPVKKSLYAELLHKKYGILEPRYKK